MEAIYWLIIFLVLLLIEIFTLGLTTIWFAIGAVAAIIAALAGAEVIVQVMLFIIVSFITLVLTRPIAVKYLRKNTLKTNVDELIGKTAETTKPIIDENNIGEAKIEGEIWLAKSVDGKMIKEGEIVKVVEVNGVKLIVKKSI